MPGIFIRKGMTGSVPEFAISMAPDGQLSGKMVMHVHFDVCAIWLRIALDHLEAARAHAASVNAAWISGTGDDQAAALDLELAESMQAVVACAIAIDALYANIRASLTVPGEAASFSKKRGPRFKQVASMMRLGFGLEPIETALLESDLEKTFRLRNTAVHPSGLPAAPIVRADIGVAVEWRFAKFSFSHVRGLVGSTIGIFYALVNAKNVSDGRLRRYIDGLMPAIVELLPRARALCSEHAEHRNQNEEPQS